MTDEEKAEFFCLIEDAVNEWHTQEDVECHEQQAEDLERVWELFGKIKTDEA